MTRRARTATGSTATLAVLLALLGAACVKTASCKPGTLLVHLRFEGAARDVGKVEVMTTVGTATKKDSVTHTRGDETLTIQFDLASYVAGTAFHIDVVGHAGTDQFSQSVDSQLGGGCSSVTLTLAVPADGGATVSDAGDGPAADLACGPNAHVCGTACADNADPTTCGDTCGKPCKLPPNADHATCDGATCGFVCKSGFHRCGDLCADDKSAMSCGSSCSACVPPTGGMATCDGTTCGGACKVDQKLCAGTCIDMGTACTSICAIGTHDCNGLCALNTSINTCGASACTACATPANGMASCDGTACGAKCQDGYKDCPDATCVPIGGCCTSGDCLPPANSLATCTPAHACGVSCKRGFHTCGARCVDDKDPDHCGTSCDACTAPTGGSATCDGQSCGGDCPQDKQLCAGTCIPTSQPCMNMCAAGTHDCNGLCLANKSANSCGASCDPCSVPDNATPTCDGTTCDFKCGASYKRCGMICIPTTGCCGAADCPQIANGAATCSANHLCGFTCDGGHHPCNGTCASDQSTASCGTSCSACAAPQGGMATCDGTSCGAGCPMGQKVCANACIPDGQACMGMCPAGTHDCFGLCRSNTSVNSCGARCFPCQAGANATATCTMGLCGDQCNSGFKRCGTACIDSSLCCDDGDCSGGACMSGLCCATGQTNCGGTCVNTGSDQNNCGACGRACQGRCSMGLCCGANQNACGGVCTNTNTDGKHCGASCTACPLNLLCSNGKCVL